VLAACVLAELGAKARRRQLQAALILMLIGAAALPFVARLGSTQTPNAIYRQFAPWMGAALAVGTVGLLLAWRLDARRPDHALAAYALSFFALTTILLRGHESFGASSSGAALAARVAPFVRDDAPIYAVRLIDHTLPFYLHHVITPVEEPGELEFGLSQEPQKWLPTVADFIGAWTSKRPALAVMSHQTYDELRSRKLPMVVVGEDVRRVVVSNVGS